MSRDWTIRMGVLAPVALCAVLYLTALDAAGLLGPDEPRYAWIAREMARTGDWVTPKLWGQPWFEKPPLTYWMMALAFRCGLGDDLAPRLPVALASLLFLASYRHALAREFGPRAATFATLILGTSAGWLAYSRIGVTDIPLAVTFSGAMLAALPWLARGDRRLLPLAAALLGLAVLAKGLVPVVLSLPLIWLGRRRCRDLLRPAPAAVFLLVAAPWYVAMTVRHGRPFIDQFFLQHHLARIYADTLQHVQPWWFYIPVLITGLLPWAPLAALTARCRFYADVRLRFFLWLTIFGLVFFSLVRNKLPGYLLPLMPAACALAGVALDRAEQVRWQLAAAAASLALAPLAAGVLPSALEVGIRKAQWPEWSWAGAVAAAPLALWCWRQAPRRAGHAVWTIALGVAVAVLWMARTTLPVLDHSVSVRGFWRATGGAAAHCCVEAVGRERHYGLNYYARRPLPDCRQQPQACRIVPAPGGLLTICSAQHRLN
ncbi:MAG: ArnT family glycosyltransferase [Bryobacteraceae bacterium]